MKIRNVENNMENKVRSILLRDGHFRCSAGSQTKSTSPTWRCYDEKNSKGITLIALIITIILMLILAGVVLSLTLGKNGLINTAKYAVTKTEEERAREKLELALADLQAYKYTNLDYDENEYIDNYLSKEGMIVEGDIVIVDGWKFTIDRSVPKIGESLGKREESKNIELVATVENSKDYTKATINIAITYEETITEIKINGQQENIPEKNEAGKYILSTEVTTNGKYTVYVKNENNEYKTAIVNVTEISEDMEIRTAEELVYFRDRVNKGATYEGRTIKVVKNIDLSKVCYKVDGTIENDISWEPIGTFLGIFNGNYKTISNLYINSNTYSAPGLFGENYGIIKNTILDKVYIYSTSYNTSSGKRFTSVGGITAHNLKGASISNCSILSGKIEYQGKFTTESYLRVGGICGNNSKSTISNCYNNAEVTTINSSTNESVRVFAGGIAGESNNSLIINCYNRNTITGKGGSSSSGTGGIVAAGNGTIENSYNYGTIMCTPSSSRRGGIGGRLDAKAVVRNSYCINNTTYSYYLATSAKKAGRVTEEELKSYSISDEFLPDVQNEDETWKYNNGYPILKWQVQKK